VSGPSADGDETAVYPFRRSVTPNPIVSLFFSSLYTSKRNVTLWWAKQTRTHINITHFPNWFDETRVNRFDFFVFQLQVKTSSHFVGRFTTLCATLHDRSLSSSRRIKVNVQNVVRSAYLLLLAYCPVKWFSDTKICRERFLRTKPF